MIVKVFFRRECISKIMKEFLLAYLLDSILYYVVNERSIKLIRFYRTFDILLTLAV